MNVFFMREEHEFGGPGAECYILHVCVPASSYVVFGGTTSAGVIRVEPSCMGLVPLQMGKVPPESSLALLPCEDTAKRQL